VELAELYQDQGNSAAAEPLYKRAVAIVEKNEGPNHPNLAASLVNLAALYQSEGNYSSAEPLYKRALAIYEKAQGPEHPNLAGTLVNVALFYQEQGNYCCRGAAVQAGPGHLREGFRAG